MQNETAPDDGLVEALRPFAAIADEYDDAEDDDFQVWKDFDVLGASLPLKNFRRARAALRAHTAQPAAVVRCAECDCEAGGEACNWIKPGPAAGVPDGRDPKLTKYYLRQFIPGNFSDWLDKHDAMLAEIDRLEALTAALAAAPRAGVPEGWRLVPVEPNGDMREAYWLSLHHGGAGPKEPQNAWAAMLAAAPQPTPLSADACRSADNGVGYPDAR